MTERPKFVENGELRADVRTAILNYTSKQNFALDSETESVRPAASEDRFVLPKISWSTMLEWRAQFVDFVDLPVNEELAGKLSEWAAGQLPSRGLPPRFRKLWSIYLTNVITELLQRWSSEFDDDDSMQDYVDSDNNLAVGELLVLNAKDPTDSTPQALFAQACSFWASPGSPPSNIVDIETLIAMLDRFVPEVIAIATVQATWRFRELGIEPPQPFGDLVFKQVDALRAVYSLPDKLSGLACISAAIAKTEQTLAELKTRVNAFSRSTTVTAKVPSIAVLKQMHRYSKFALPAEQALMRDIDVLVGPIFRKFCEGCERRQPDVIATRGNELRVHVQRLMETIDVSAPGRLTEVVVRPTIEHVTALIDEGTEQGDAQSAPRIKMAGDVVKIDMSGGEATFLGRIRNDGRGKASAVCLLMDEDPPNTVISFCDDFAKIDVEAGVERIVRLQLTTPEPVPELHVQLTWTCIGTNDRIYEFDQSLTFVQQNKQPDWDALIDDPPYIINPIKRRSDLYGRDTILNELSLHIASGTSTFLWGQKRVGKTSVLQVLAREINHQINRVCFVLRMGELASLHEGQIAHEIAMRLAGSFSNDIEVPPVEHFGAGMGRLVPFVERICEAEPSKRFTIVIDEFDDLDPAFYTGERGKQFVKALRSLSEVGLTFFFVGSERMDAIYKDHASDLNKWINVSLDRIDSDDDCTALIVQPVADAIEFEPDAVRRIIDYCRGNPFYTHLLCSAVFRRCWQERRTYVGRSDLEYVRRDLLRTLSRTNFAHLWEDNPVLSISQKQHQSAENCLYLSCVAALGGAYNDISDLRDAQETLHLEAPHRLPTDRLRDIEARMLRRKVVVSSESSMERVRLQLPMFADWLFENAESQLLPLWCSYCDEQMDFSDEPAPEQMSLVEAQAFPIPEDELLAVSEKLVFHNKQVDVAELRRWLKQFDDDSRIEIAYLLLKRLAERGFVSQGAMNVYLTHMQEAINARRLEVGEGKWTVVRGRLDNLCITYVDSDVKSGAATARDVLKRMRPGKAAASTELRSWLDGHIDLDPMVVFVDDFAGSGNTLVKGLRKCWKVNPDIMSSLAQQGRVLCCLQSAFPEAIQQLNSEFPEVDVSVMRVFGDEVRAFDASAGIFDSDGDLQFAKDVLLQIGRQLQPQHPIGYENMGVLVSFHNTAPNNSLPVFWCDGTVNKRKWTALFPRA